MVTNKNELLAYFPPTISSQNKIVAKKGGPDISEESLKKFREIVLGMNIDGSNPLFTQVNYNVLDDIFLHIIWIWVRSDTLTSLHSGSDKYRKLFFKTVDKIEEHYRNCVISRIKTEELKTSVVFYFVYHEPNCCDMVLIERKGAF